MLLRHFAHVLVSVSCLVLLSPVGAFAQAPSTVGELLASGGRRLARDELLTVVSGATLSGLQIDRPDVTFEVEYRKDGTVRGFARTNRELLSMTGTWLVDEQGRYCNDLSNNRGGTVRNCVFLFVLDSSYFSDT